MDRLSLLSTPGADGSDGKRRRRSWFEAEPVSFEIAVEKNTEISPVAPSDEVLELTHFTKAPRVDFGKVQVGKIKTCCLRVRNPKDYEQTVVLEKFPSKKNFSTEKQEYTLLENEECVWPITWQPQDSGNCREMVLFRVDKSYRLTAILFGYSDEPKKVKKKLHKKKKPLGEIQCKVPEKTECVKSVSDLKRFGKVPDVSNFNASELSAAKENCALRKKNNVKLRKSSPDSQSVRSNNSQFNTIQNGTIVDVVEIENLANNAPVVIESNEARLSLGKSATTIVSCPGQVITSQKLEDKDEVEALHVQEVVCDASQGLDTPSRRTTFVKDDPTLPCSPARRFTFVKSRSSLNPSVHQLSRRIIEGCNINTQVDSFSQNSFEVKDPIKDRNSLTPTRRSTFEKETPSTPQVQMKEMLFRKEDSDISTPETEKFIPRSSFIPDDPALPITPLRRTTFLKEQSPLPNTPVIECCSPVRILDTLTTPPTVKNVPQKHNETPCRVWRSDPFDLQSPAQVTSYSTPPHRFHFQPSSPQIPEEIGTADDLTSPDDLLATGHQASSNDSSDSLRNAIQPLETSLSPVFSVDSLDNQEQPVVQHIQFTAVSNTICGSALSLPVPLLCEDQLVPEYNAVTTESSPTSSKYLSPASTIYDTAPSSPSGLMDDSVFLASQLKDKLDHLLRSNNQEAEQIDTNYFRANAADDKTPVVSSHGSGTHFDVSGSPIVVPNLAVIAEEESPTFVIMNNSLGHVKMLERLENVKTELGRRLSSTPVSGPCIPHYGKDSLPCNLSTLSPIISDRVNSETVTKNIAVSLFSSTDESSDQSSKRSSRKTLFKDGSSEHRLSNLTVSKSNPSGFLNSDTEENPPAETSSEHRLSNTTVTKTSPAIFHIKKDDHGCITEVTSQNVLQPLLQPADIRRFSTMTITKSKSVKCVSEDIKSSRKLFGAESLICQVKEQPVISEMKNSVQSMSMGEVRHKWVRKPPLPKQQQSAKSDIKEQERLKTRRSFAAKNENNSSQQSRNSSQLKKSLNNEVVKKRCHSTERLTNTKQDTASTSKRPRRSDVFKPEIKAESHATSNTEGQSTRTQQLRRKSSLQSMNRSAPVSAKESFNTSKQKCSKPPKGLGMSKLVLLGSNANRSVPAIPKHPLPYAAKNVYYDERWMIKQDHGFVRWLNFVLTPPDEYFEAKKPQKIDAGLLISTAEKSNPSLAPTKEALSLRAYSARRRLNRLRKQSCRLFQNEDTVKLIKKLEIEIESNHLAVRKDRKLHADLGIKQRLLEMILSYNPLWLRLGLETVYGEMVPLQHNTDVFGLSRFIVLRLLSNPDIALQYAHPTVPHLYKEGYDEALAQFTLKKFLLLVFFLDCAKNKRLIQHDPCLFCKDSDFKSSRDLLLAFSRDHLSGEGDLTRHLSYMGFTVSYVQTALEEYDYAVTNLATDLTDGIRLARVIEMLRDDYQISSQLRLPAISRLQKVHNVGLSINTLVSHGVDITVSDGKKIDSRDIVDGHREKTLRFLWMIIFHFQVDQLLDEKQLREEICFLQTNLKVQKQLVLLGEDCYISDAANRRESISPDLYQQNPRLSLLLRWCKAVCAFYSIKIENFTVAFSDGRALCYLLHHYHPSLLKIEEINMITTQTQENRNIQNLSASDSDDSFLGAWSPSEKDTDGGQEELLLNERANYKLLYEKVLELGGVPIMVKSADMCGTIPDEKMVITYVSYLCARLLDLRHETRAARIIQAAWRCYRLRHKVVDYKERNKAASKIQHHVRIWLHRLQAKKRENAARKLQYWWRMVSARLLCQAIRKKNLLSRQTDAAVRIQAHIRGFQVFQRYHKRQQAVCIIQRKWHAYQERCSFLRKKNSITFLQKWYKSILVTRKQREDFLQIRKSATVIQHAFRTFHKKKLLQEENASKKIQSYYRGYRAKVIYTQKRKAVSVLQASVRMYIQKRRYNKVHNAILTIQAAWRSKKLTQQYLHEYLRMKNACLVLQRTYRCYTKTKRQQEEKRKNNAAILLQSHYRGFKTRKNFLRMKAAAVVLQFRWRAHQQMLSARTNFCKVRSFTVIIQACYRRSVQRNKFCEVKLAATKIQSFWRGFTTRKQYTNMKQAAVVIQTRWRALIVGRKKRQTYLNNIKAAICLQSAFRKFYAVKKYKQTRITVIRMQALCRGNLCRLHLQTRLQAATSIQIYWRAYWEGLKRRLDYLKLRRSVLHLQSQYRGQQVRMWVKMTKAACLIQCHYRGHLVRRDCLQMRLSAVKIQALYKGYMARKKTQGIRQACAVIQRAWRSCVIARKERAFYLRMREASTTIQSHVRGYWRRKQYSAVMTGIKRLQAVVRAKKQRLLYLRHKAAAVIIQIHWRRRQLAKYDADHYRKLKNSTIKIQSAFRAHTARKQVKCIRSAIKIQSLYRGYIQRHRYLRVRKATIFLQTLTKGYLEKQRYRRKQCAMTTIQRHYRAHCLRKQAYEQYQVIRLSVLKIQSVYRNYIIRKEEERYRSAVIIQSSVRRYQARKSYLKTYAAVLVMQHTIRGHQQRKQFLKLKDAAIRTQRRFRSVCTCQSVRKEYLITRSKIVKVQSYYRMYRARKDYVTARENVIKIQALYKGYREERNYTLIRMACVTIQRMWRSRCAAKRQRGNYLEIKSAALKIQSHYRGYKAECQYKIQRRKVIMLQARIRGFLQYRKYERIRQASIVIQRYWHAIKEGVKVRADNQRATAAALMIQSAYRGYKARVDCKTQICKIVKLQAVAKSVIQCKRYRQMRISCLIIQRQWRACLEGRSVRRELFRYQAAALIIQTCYRGYRERHLYESQRSHIIKAQAVTKRYLQFRKYQKIRFAAIVIQNHWRARLEGQKVRNALLKSHGAAVILQSAYRGHRARQTYLRQYHSIICVQSHVRGYVQKKRYEKIKCSAISIQIFWRARLEAQKVRNALLKSHAAAVILQSAYRRHRARQTYLKQYHRIICVQSHVRGYVQKKRYEKIKCAAICIQMYWRACMLGKCRHSEYMTLLRGIVSLQAVVRMRRERQRYSALRESAVRIQAAVRCLSERRRYTIQRCAALSIQRRWRATLVTRKLQYNYRRVLAAVVCIQSAYRGMVQRQRIRSYKAALTIQSAWRGQQARRLIIQQHAAAVIIQSCYRRHCEQENYQIKRRAIIVIQQRFRCYQLGRETQLRYLQFKSACLIVQSVYRGHLARQKAKLHRAARLVQSFWKMFKARSEYNVMRAAAVSIQKNYKMYVQRSLYRKKQRAVSIIVNGWLARQGARKQRDYYVRLRAAAVCLEAAYRGHVQRKRYHLIRRGFIHLQAKVKGYIQRKRYSQLVRATYVIQAQYKAIISARQQLEQYQKLRRAVLAIQVVYRGQQVRKYVEKMKAAILIQSTYRMFRERKAFLEMRREVVRMQACYRCVRERRDYLEKRKAVCTLQRHVRAYLYGKAARVVCGSRKNAILTLQAHFKGYLTRKKLKQQRSAVVIQSIFRSYRRRKLFLQQIKYVECIQAAMRDFLLRRRVNEMRQKYKAAATIQAYVRGYITRKGIEEQRSRRNIYLDQFANIARKNLHALTIQRIYRKHLIIVKMKEKVQSIVVIQNWMRAKLLRLRFLKLKHAANTLQHAWRIRRRKQNNAVVIMQTAVRSWLARQHVKNMQQSALRIQSLWRGYYLRKNTKSKKVHSMRKRVQEAAKNATEDKKLCNRTSDALDFLLCYKQLSYILEALINLDVATRLSWRCCQRIVEGHAVQVILRLVRSCNRSLPHMELIRYSINILLNLAKYEKTVESVFSATDSLETLLELMQVYREKGFIFNKTCMLVGLLAHDPSRRKVMLDHDRLVERLQSIYTLTARKHKIDEKRQMTRAKMNASQSFCGFVPGQTSPTKPRFRPAWVLSRDSVGAIEDPFLAIRFTMTSLHLKPK